MTVLTRPSKRGQQCRCRHIRRVAACLENGTAPTRYKSFSGVYPSTRHKLGHYSKHHYAIGLPGPPVFEVAYLVRFTALFTTCQPARLLDTSLDFPNMRCPFMLTNDPGRRGRPDSFSRSDWHVPFFCEGVDGIGCLFSFLKFYDPFDFGRSIEGQRRERDFG